MRYFSLKDRNNYVDFKEATLLGQAPDGGLYYPESIPVWNNDFIRNLKRKSKLEIGFEIMAPYVGNTIPEKELYSIIEQDFSAAVWVFLQENWPKKLLYWSQQAVIQAVQWQMPSIISLALK